MTPFLLTLCKHSLLAAAAQHLNDERFADIIAEPLADAHDTG